MAKIVLGGNDVVVRLVDNTPLSKGGLGVIIDNAILVSTTNDSSNASIEKFASLGKSTFVTKAGAKENSLSISVMPSFDSVEDASEVLKRIERIENLVAKENLTMFMYIYEPGTENKSNRDDFLIGTKVFNGVVCSSRSSGFNAGASSSAIELSFTYEDSKFM